ncbi:MAG: 50S ribosomal protein P1 [Thermoplasmata archaeon]|nr:MAG: 50S ribosomal protein P1 [Thermoplasmata archaeon]
MEYVYSALLLHSAGKEVTEDAITKVLKAADVDVDAARVKALTTSLEGVNIDDAVATAVAVPAAGAPAAAAPAAAEGGDEPAKEEEKKEEEDKVSEEDAAAGLSALFG